MITCFSFATRQHFTMSCVELPNRTWETYHENWLASYERNISRPMVDSGQFWSSGAFIPSGKSHLESLRRVLRSYTTLPAAVKLQSYCKQLVWQAKSLIFVLNMTTPRKSRAMNSLRRAHPQAHGKLIDALSCIEASFMIKSHRLRYI